MGNCCVLEPPAINITKKIGVQDGQMTAIKFRGLPNNSRWLYITHKNPNGSDITLKMMKEELAKICKCEPTHILCYIADERDIELGVHVELHAGVDLPDMLFRKNRYIELHYLQCSVSQYSDLVYKAPPLGEVYPADLSVKEWSAKQVLWWLEIIESNRWLAEKFKNSQITGRQLLLMTELTLKDLGITNPAERISLLDKIYQLY